MSEEEFQEEFQESVDTPPTVTDNENNSQNSTDNSALLFVVYVGATLTVINLFALAFKKARLPLVIISTLCLIATTAYAGIGLLQQS